MERMMNLAQFENLADIPGYDATPLEQQVFGNPSFKFLREKDLDEWAELATGLKKVGVWRDGRDQIATELIEGEPVSPHAIGKRFEQFAEHFQSVLRMTAKVRRDANLDNVHDRELLDDLFFWLLKVSDRGFRWERYIHEIEEQDERKARAARIEALKQGNSDVIVLVLTRLTPPEREQVREQIFQNLIQRRVLGVECYGPEIVAIKRHMPGTKCRFCYLPQVNNLRIEHGWGPKGCKSRNVIVLVDAGDIQSCLEGLPRTKQRLISVVRFKVPQSTFVDSYTAEIPLPEMFVICLDQLSKEKQQRVYHELEVWFGDKQRYESSSDYPVWRPSSLIRPEGSDYMNALLISGLAAGGIGHREDEDAWTHHGLTGILKTEQVTMSVIDPMRSY